MLAGLSTAFGGSMNRTGPVALTLGALLLLASCSGEDADAKPTPTASASGPSATSASPTPSETPPTMPAQANAPFPEGAPAFTKYYVDVLNHAARTGDSTKLRELSAPECEGCQEYIQGFDGTRVDRSEPLWQLGPEVELYDDKGGKAVVTSVAVLRNDNTREQVPLVFVVGDETPRKLVGLFIKES